MAFKDEYLGAYKFLCSDAILYINGLNNVIDRGRAIW